MKYLCDTNVFSELAKKEPQADVVDWMSDHQNELFMSTVTVEELYYGVQLMDEGKRKVALQNLIEGLINNYAGQLLAFDQEAAVICARLHALAKKSGFTPTLEDLMIAAISVRNGCVLATRNVKDFEYVEIPLVNPFELDECFK